MACIPAVLTTLFFFICFYCYCFVLSVTIVIFDGTKDIWRQADGKGDS